jgi:peptidoglycan/xylan/chitin deacetylase (PgdA/CDA1 family)
MNNSDPERTENRPIGWKPRLKFVVYFCLYWTGLEWLLARLIRVDAAAILMYHGVCDNSAMPSHINFHHNRRMFERQMRLLKRRYRVVPLGEVVDALARKQSLNKSVVLTFDDGYRNNQRAVAPILKRLDLPFTIFVATAYIGTDRWMPLNEVYWRWSSGELTIEDLDFYRKQLRGRPRAESGELIGELHTRPLAASPAAEESFAMLNWDEIQAMARARIEFGSHTHTHCNMAAESPSQQRVELEMSRDLLESRLNRPIRTFAYPYGHTEHMSESSRRNVIAAGYDCAVSAEYGLVTSRSDRFCLPRLGGVGPIWTFAGEIVYHFARVAASRTLARLRGYAKHQHA